MLSTDQFHAARIRQKAKENQANFITNSNPEAKDPRPALTLLNMFNSKLMEE